MVTGEYTRKLDFALTGGMGSGKSTTARILKERGATIFDADATVKDLQKPGRPGFEVMVHFLGEEVIDPQGELDRKKAASLIFDNADLNIAIKKAIHPMVWKEMRSGAKQVPPEKIAVFDVPLLNPTDGETMLGVVVVNTSVELAVERLQGEDRGFTEEEARARIKTQSTNEERLKIADFVINNNSDLDSLVSQSHDAWAWMNDRAHQVIGHN